MGNRVASSLFVVKARSSVALPFSCQLGQVVAAMQVLEVHHAFLSNFEVMQHLKAEVHEQQRAIAAFKKAHPAPKPSRHHQEPEPGKPYFDYQSALSKIVPDNLRTLQVETLTYLDQPDLPKYTVAKLKAALRALNEIEPLPDTEQGVGYGLTKTEKLMMVNLAPARLVDLTVVCDELDTRFTSEAQEKILQIFHPEATLHTTEEDDEALEEVKEEEEMHDMAEEQHDEDVQDNLHDVYGEEQYDESAVMPDEENDLIDEGMGDGGRDAEIREIDEAGDGE